MAEHSRIEWTDATWNPVTGCTLVSEGCRNCYAAELAAGRLAGHPSRHNLARRNADGVAAFTGEVRLNAEWLDLPLRWRRPRRIFVCAHGDLFHEAVPDEWINRVFAVMALSPQHTFQVLTKRPERMRDYMLVRDEPEAYDRRSIIYGELAGWGSKPVSERGYGAKATLVAAQMDRLYKAGWPLPNVWLGVSAEDQATADARIPDLLATPAAIRFLSAEPLLGPLDLAPYLSPHFQSENERYPKLGELDWVIAGGESGRHARPMHPDWARALRDQCRTAGVPFFFKQWGEWFPGVIEMNDSYDRELGPRVALPDVEHDHSAENWEGRVSGSTRIDGEDMLRVGRRRAGRKLDNREHSEMPDAQ